MLNHINLNHHNEWSKWSSIVTHGKDFEELDFVSADLCLHPHTEGPDEPNQWPEHQKSQPVGFLVPDVESHPLDQSRHFVPVPEVLIRIKGVVSSESPPRWVKVLSAYVVNEPVINQVVNENHQSHGPDVIGIPTVVSGGNRVNDLRSPVGDDFLLSRVVLGLGPAFAVWNGSCVMSGFVMVTLDWKCEMTVQALDSLVLLSESVSMFDFVQVTKQRIATHAQDEIQKIGSRTDPAGCPWT